MELASIPDFLEPPYKKALDKECEKVATADHGARNDILNKSAFAIGQLIGGSNGALDESYAKERLCDEAIAVGLDKEETKTTIKSGLDAGKNQPRSINKKPRIKFERTSLSTIMETDYPELQWSVEGYLPEGFSILAGRQKLGKTWLALNFSLAIATTGKALSEIECDQGDVLYLDLENGHRRIKRRIEEIYPFGSPDLTRFDVVNRAPLLNDGFIDELEAWRKSVSRPTLAVIDVLQRIKPAGERSRNAYENDYAIFSPLQSWATENRIAVLALHHTKKGAVDDPLEALSGSNGLSACADTTLVLDKNGQGTTLYVRGRDVEEKESAIEFNQGTWALLGDAEEVIRSDERKAVLEALKINGEAMRPTEIADVIESSHDAIRRLVRKMAHSGEIENPKYGFYSYPSHSGHTGHTK